MSAVDWMEHLDTPLWTGQTVYGESVLFVDHADGTRCARLLFAPTEIVRVESASGETTYQEGVDFRCAGNTLVLPAGSAIPCKTVAELHPLAASSGLPEFIRLRGQPDRGLLFSETGLFHQLQTCVTYRHRDSWAGPIPVPAATSLPRSWRKLRRGEPLVLGVSGDSISVGANASKYNDLPPHQPAYPELVAAALGSIAGFTGNLRNRAVGGWTSLQGLGDAEALAAERPDLVLIAYGMNDNLQLEASNFRANIAGIIAKVRAGSPAAEFILVAGMCGNTDWAPIRPEVFTLFRDTLLALQEPGVVCADVTSVWLELMRRKSFLDVTGNGVNHPNDFAHRIYAQTILSLFGESVRTTVPRGGGTRLP
jgi:acyl-CoA thioesterase-1